jgi:DNA-directed RNA polymerase subunit beta'
MVLGVYYLTMEKADQRGEGMVFADPEEVELAYALGLVNLHAKIKLFYPPRKEGGKRKAPIETTVGRALFNQIVPEAIRYVNELLDKGGLQRLVAKCYQKLGPTETTDFVDRIKTIGFKYATISGTTIAVSDITVPQEKYAILDKINAEVTEVEREYRRGLLTEDEQYNRTIELWQQATTLIASAVKKGLDPQSPLAVLALSGAAKGGFQPISQLAGMRGLMADPAGRIISLPIKSSFREGLTALEYFISTHGARKGLADTALRTADAGYLTRRLVDVAQDMIVNDYDCGTKAGLWVRRADDVGGQSLACASSRVLAVR